MSILFSFASCSNSSSSGGGNPFSETEWKNSSATLKFYSDGTVGGNAITASGGDLKYKVSHDGNSYTATIYAEISGQKFDQATFTISNEDASSGTLKIIIGGITSTLSRVGGSSSSGNGGNPFSETEWKNSSATLKFYSDGTVGGNAITATGGDLKYKVSHNGNSYTADIYAEIAGQKFDQATFTISNEDASSGTLSLTAGGVTVTFQRAGGSSSSGEASGSGIKVPSGSSSSGGNSSSNSEGTKGGSYGDPFLYTTWSNSSKELYFLDDGTVHYKSNGMSFYYDYYFSIGSGYYIAKAYQSGSLMFTFEFSLSDPTVGDWYSGSSNGHGYGITLKRSVESSSPSYDSSIGDSYYDGYWYY